MFPNIFKEEFYPDYYNDVYTETLDQIYNVDVNYRCQPETTNVYDEGKHNDDDLSNNNDRDFYYKAGENGNTSKQKKLGLRGNNPGIVNFIVDLLHNPDTNPSIIRWENFKEGKFRFINPEKVSKLWGMRNMKSKEKEMDFGKFSRAIRYHYSQGNFMAVPEQKLVYKFGPNAKGWQENDSL